MSIHRIKPGKESLMIDSMHRFSESAKAAGPALMKAVEGDGFGDWHEEDWQSYHCFEV